MPSELPFLGRGWSFPPSFSPGGADVGMVSGAADVHESLRILLATAPGERVMQPLFGCDMGSVVFEEMTQGLVNQLTQLVGDAILFHEPRIKVDRLDVTSSSEEGKLLIRVDYTIRGTNSRFNMVYPFYLKEATFPGL
jgi:phage baseplate assembly protein W